MALDSAFFLRIKGHIGPHDSDTEIWYARDTEDAGYTAAAFLNDWHAAVWTAQWQPLASDQFVLDTLSGHFYNNTTGNMGDYTKYVNETGENADEALPPWLTVNITKVPDMSTVIPFGAPWRNGFVGLPGLPEIGQVNGYMTDLARDDWDGVAQAIKAITPTSGATQVFKWGMYRFYNPTEENPDPPPASRVVCGGAWVKQRTGTRNSRKKL